MKNIAWLEWSKEAFEKAKREDKPILLDIHGVWCHWCHIADKTTYSDEIVIDTVNEKFVPIKVDTDKRPDINERYNQGGWPTTAFLSPDGALIAGATYVPPAQLATMLEQVWNYYKNNKNKIKPELQSHENEKGDVKSVLDDVAEEVVASFDTEYGGFGSQPKFPFPDTIELAMLKYRKGDKTFLRLATKTLDGMVGIFDGVAGGFYRYSVTRNWDEPHYEKMLETNAQLILNYLHAYQLAGSDKYKIIAERTADYLLSTLHGPYGFYGSQDADGEEEYYGKPAEEREKMKQPFIDRNIYVNLNGLAISAFLKLGGKYLYIGLGTLDTVWPKCFDENKGMCHYYDGKPNVYGLLTDNVNFVRCLLDAYEANGNKKYLENAKRLMDFVIEKFFDNGFNDRISSREDIGLLSMQNKSIADNSIAADCLIRLDFHLNNGYRDVARKSLSLFVQDYKKYSLHSALYAIVVEKFLNPIEIVSTEKFDFYDPRILVKIVKRGEEGLDTYVISVCRDKKCIRFKSLDEAKSSVME